MTIPEMNLPALLSRVRKEFDEELAHTLRKRTDLTHEQIAREFGVSHKVIRRVAREFGIRRRRASIGRRFEDRPTVSAAASSE